MECPMPSHEPRELTKLVIQRLPPAGAASSSYIVLDTHPDAPRGFGVRVTSSGAKSFVIQRRQGKAVKKVTVGRYPDMSVGRDVPPERNARFAASAIALRLFEGEDVTATRRAERQQATRVSKSLGDLFDEWVDAYKLSRKRKRQQVKENTLRAVARARTRLGALVDTPAAEVTFSMLKARFDEISERHQTAAEQTVRWVSAVYNKANEEVQLAAEDSDVEALLYRNPAEHFGRRGLLRTRLELENSYKKSGARAPLNTDMSAFRAWLDYVLEARTRRASRTAADYMLLALLLGFRRTEAKTLQWSDAAKSLGGFVNVVDLGAGRIRLGDTKNHYLHEVPIPTFCRALLEERRVLVSRTTSWVFPAVSRSPRRKVECYSDSRAFMNGIKVAVGKDFSEHDLRRTFANIAVELGVVDPIVKQLLNHKQANGATGLYTTQSIPQLLVVLQRIEDAILSHASCNLGKEVSVNAEKEAGAA
jgi:integrase